MEDGRAKLGTPGVRGGAPPDPIYPIVFSAAINGHGEALHSTGGITVGDIAVVKVTAVERYIAQVEYSIAAAVEALHSSGNINHGDGGGGGGLGGGALHGAAVVTAVDSMVTAVETAVQRCGR